MPIFRVKLKNDNHPLYVKARSFCITGNIVIFNITEDVNVAALKDWDSILAFRDIDSAKEFDRKLKGAENVNCSRINSQKRNLARRRWSCKYR